MTYPIKKIAELIGGEIFGDNTLEVEKLSPFFDADENDVTFAADEKYLKKLYKSKAKVIIVPFIENLPEGKTYIKLKNNPRNAMPAILNFFKKKQKKMEKSIEDSAIIGENVNISPNCYIGHDVTIGKNTFIYPNVVILEGSKVGENCIIYPNVTIREFSEIGNDVILQPGAVIGSDGFGFIKVAGNNFKLEQIGNVIIEDQVELGANVTIDRGAIGDTIIKRGTKMDNLVQIGHNDKIGENCMIVAQAGIAGSVEIGSNTTIAGQVGIAGHLKVGKNCIIAGKSGVTNNVPDNSTMSGYPLREHREDLKIKIAMTKVPQLIKRVNKLEKKIEDK